MRNFSLKTAILLLILLLLTLGGASATFAQDDDAEATPEAADALPEATEPSTIDYEIPPVPEGVDLDQVVGRVGDEAITLGEVAERVRYQRFYFFYALDQLVEERGEGILNLEDPANQLAPTLNNLLSQLAADDDFARSMYETIIFENLYAQEAQAREIAPDDCRLNQLWLQVLVTQGVSLDEDCQLPAEQAAQRDAFLRQAEIFTGATAEDIVQSLTAQSLAQPIFDAVAEEYEPEEQEVARSRHIRVSTEETANEVLERLEAGEAFEDLLAEYTIDPGLEGTRGSLGTFGRGMMVAPFEEAAFGAEAGEIVGPVETQFGFHVINVEDKTAVVTRNARHILLATEDDANAALGLLERGNDFAEIAARYSLDAGTAGFGGDLGFVSPGSNDPALVDAVYEAEIGEIVGPVQTASGFHVVEVLGEGEPLEEVTASHILVETEEEAEAALERLDAGEDFGDLAAELSIEPGAGGHGGSTNILLAGGGEEGFFNANQVPPQISEAVFDAEAGEIIGPVGPVLNDQGQSSGFYIIEVLEFDMQAPPETSPQVQQARQNFVVDWQEEQFASDRIEETTLWRQFIPQNPLPSDVSSALIPLDATLAEFQEQFAAFQQANNIPSILSNLVVPEFLLEQPEEPEAEATAEATDEAISEATPEAEATEEATEEDGD